MRIAIAGISHETNTYCMETTPLEAFSILRGEAIFRARGTETSLGGALAACDDLGIVPLPVLAAGTQPSGTIERAAYESMRDEITAGVKAVAPDGVFLDLHGAGVVDGYDDLEADLAESVRAAVGPDVPIAASFDLHGNVTQRMANALDGMFACHHYPHIDMHLRAREAIELISTMHSEGFKTHVLVESVPMLMPTTTTFEGIGQRMIERVLSAEAEAGVLDVSWFHGFPYTDIPHVGSHLVATTRRDAADARRAIETLARTLWQEREDYRPISLSADEAVAEAGRAAKRPVVINETSDNCGGGTPGDGTHLLRAMLEAKVPNAAFGFIVDADVAAQAHAAGTGATIEVSLGGKTDDLHGEPLELAVYVKALHDGHITMQAMGKGAPLNLGPMARLIVDGFDILVASRRSQTFDPEPFLALGIDVRRLDTIALKSSNHFRAGFQDLAGTIVTADPPGLTTHHIEIFPRQLAPGAMWPIDTGASYTAPD